MFGIVAKQVPEHNQVFLSVQIGIYLIRQDRKMPVWQNRVAALLFITILRDTLGRAWSGLGL